MMKPCEYCGKIHIWLPDYELCEQVDTFKEKDTHVKDEKVYMGWV